MLHGTDGLAEKGKDLLAECTRHLSDGEPSEQVDAQFRSSLQALLDRATKKSQAELEKCLQARKAKLPEPRMEEARRKLQMPVEYQGELMRYTWTLCLTDAVDRDQLRALKVHFKKTIEELWQADASQALAESQARNIFATEWAAFEDKCRARFERTAKSQKQLAEEVCLVFNHALRQHRHGDEALHVVELVPASALLNEQPMSSWDPMRVAKEFLEVRVPGKLAEYASHRPERAPGGDNRRQGYAVSRGARDDQDRLESIVVPELRKHLQPVLSFELADGSTQVPSEDALIEAMRRLNESIHTEETRFLAQLGVRFQGGRVAFLNAAHLCLRHSVLTGLVRA